MILEKIKELKLLDSNSSLLYTALVSVLVATVLILLFVYFLINNTNTVFSLIACAYIVARMVLFSEHSFRNAISFLFDCLVVILIGCYVSFGLLGLDFEHPMAVCTIVLVSYAIPVILDSRTFYVFKKLLLPLGLCVVAYTINPTLFNELYISFSNEINIIINKLASGFNL